jgi:protein-L-isoaspartate(D-aspartate) O-methyltransferase
MVERQLRARGIRDLRVLKAMGKVPRHFFVPDGQQHLAYADSPLPIGEGQTISQPYMVGIMTELLELKGDERVLEIGTGSGYQTAVLAELASEVVSLERIPTLAKRAEEILGNLGYHNIDFRVSDGTLGFPEKAPYQAILVTAGAPGIPTPLQNQLDAGGRLVIPTGDHHLQELEIWRLGENGQWSVGKSTACRFVDLIGEYGWEKR